jgi:hypothetical protein
VIDLLLPEILETDVASEDEMFARAEKLMDEEDLERLGARMLQLRTELLSIEQRLR